MKDKMELNTQLASALIERIHEENLPIAIDIGEDVREDMVDVLVECDQQYEDTFGKLLDDTINEIFSLEQ